MKKKPVSQSSGNAKYNEFVERYENDIDGLDKCVQVNIITQDEYAIIRGMIERNKEDFRREVEEIKSLFLAQRELYDDLVTKGIISTEMDQAVRKSIEANENREI